MKKYFIIVGILFIILLISVGFCVKTVFSEGRHYEDVDTEIKAEIDVENDIKDNNRYDYLIIEDNQYSLVQKDNYLLHASDYATVLEPFANFGDEYQYTLYEVESDCDFKVYADSKNRALYCETVNVEALLDYYSDFNNYSFNGYFNDQEEKNYKIHIDANKLNDLLSAHDDSNGGVTFLRKDAEVLNIVPLSNDNLIEECQINFIKYNDKIYIANGFTTDKITAIELTDEESEYFGKMFDYYEKSYEP
ncbi:MAG: hypothetical protein IJZ57_03935 [Clostridia bacterium]|nr:hypothetical protein [Clostridia bacterium]